MAGASKSELNLVIVYIFTGYSCYSCIIKDFGV